MASVEGFAQLTMKEPGIYKIVVSGAMSPVLRGSLAGMAISETEHPEGRIETILVGRLQDQTELAGILSTLFEMHFPILSATCLAPG